MRTLRTSDRYPLDILADVRHILTDIQRTFWRTSNGHSGGCDGHSGGRPTEILRTSDGHSGGRPTDILADVQWTFCGRPHKIPADAEYWNRISDRCPLRPQNCPTGIPADVRSLFLINFFFVSKRTSRTLCSNTPHGCPSDVRKEF